MVDEYLNCSGMSVAMNEDFLFLSFLPNFFF